MINWRKREEHPEKFQDGESMLVAVALYGGGYELAVIAVSCDEHFFNLMSNGTYWEWSWNYVYYWVPIEEILPQENKLTKGV